MLTSSDDIKKQRDRFLAFSFASADLLIEINAQGHIASTLGAAKNLTHKNEEDLQGSSWLDLFTFSDQAYLKKSIQNSVVGQRCGPYLVTLKNSKKKTLLSVIQMPNSDNFFATIGLANELADMIGSSQNQTISITPLDQDELVSIYEEKIKSAQSLNQETSITLFDLSPFETYKNQVDETTWNAVQEQIIQSINDKSYDGNSGAMLDTTKYTLLHEAHIHIPDLKDHILSLALTLSPEKNLDLTIGDKTISTNAESLTPKQLSHSLFYTLKSLKDDGANNDITDITQGYKHYLHNNKDKEERIKALIKTKRFDLHFQPIVSIPNKNLSHYEILSKFSEGSIQEWILLAEDLGLGKELDLAIVDKALNYIHYKAGTTNTRFSVNVSAQSIESPVFIEKLMKLLNGYNNIQKRLSFEITESYYIDNTKQVADHIQSLQEHGFKIALDNFGFDGSSLHYLSKLNVDLVKIDGVRIKRMKRSQHDMEIIKGIVAACHKNNIDVIADSVPDLETVKLLSDLGVPYGQGFYFSPPSSAPDYINKNKATA